MDGTGPQISLPLVARKGIQADLVPMTLLTCHHKNSEIGHPQVRLKYLKKAAKRVHNIQSARLEWLMILIRINSINYQNSTVAE